LLSIEIFNRPHDRGRVSSTLILLNHAFEMFLKAALIHRGGRIREARANQTIGFDTCVRRGLTAGGQKFLTEEQALLLQSINGLRDAAQHDLLEISEGQLYMHAQAGITLFRDLLKDVFGQDLVDRLPERVLPISTSPPKNLTALFESEVSEIKKLLRPGKRRNIEAEARIRPLVILDSAIRGEKGQPSAADLRRIKADLSSGKSWQNIFKGVSAIEITADPAGPALSLRLTKREGIPIQLVPEGTPDASVVAVKRVDELGYYSLGAKQLAEKVGLTTPKALAVVNHCDIRANAEYYREFKIGKSLFKRYSPKAVEAVKSALKKETIEEIWSKQHVNACRVGT
jgi:hypothetical protein